MSDPEQSAKNYELLIRIDEKQKAFNESMLSFHKELAEIKGELGNQISTKADGKVVELWQKQYESRSTDQELRLRRLEKVGGFAVGGLYVLVIVIEIIAKIHQ